MFEYEARASAALQQATVEEDRLDKVSKAASMKQELLDAAFKSVKVSVLCKMHWYCGIMEAGHNLSTLTLPSHSEPLYFAHTI